MKIILSPSKTMNYMKTEYLEDKEITYLKEHKQILAKLRKLKKSDIAKAYNIKGDLIDKTYQNIKNYNINDSYQAFPSFTGLVFFNLDRNSYKEKEYLYIKNHVRILDAFHGVLEPGTLIKPYRLDMKTNIGLNLYKHWNVSEYFKDELVINLASTEFSKMLDIEMVNINFLQNKFGKYVNQATYSKQARGLFLDYLIKNGIKEIELMKAFSLDGYKYSLDLSDKLNITFIR